MVHFTLSTLELQGTPAKGEGLEPSDKVSVRLLGSADQAGPAPLLKVGGIYLLYLTPSGLDGELASQFNVTGGTAGLYGIEPAATSAMRSSCRSSPTRATSCHGAATQRSHRLPPTTGSRARTLGYPVGFRNARTRANAAAERSHLHRTVRPLLMAHAVLRHRLSLCPQSG